MIYLNKQCELNFNVLRSEILENTSTIQHFDNGHTHVKE